MARNLSRSQIALSYLYWIPDSMFMVLPAAVLFATVFAIGAFTRHAEVTAAKASGISFYRMVMPVFVAALIACGLDIGLGEISPATNKRRSELLNEDKTGTGGSSGVAFLRRALAHSFFPELLDVRTLIGAR